ncbi:hypothetical protein ACFQGT_18160 [Natrialbaceae archaeon GCM10025810]|uniref:hypothetical protein n=1 Tax=Halovalidus salilacus TaxID=3075124 RepID=UPI003622051D
MAPSNTLLEVITTIIHRIDMFECLLDEPKDTRSLVADLDVSRSTVTQSVRDLEQFDLIEYRDGRYHMTLSGRLAYQSFICLWEFIASRVGSGRHRCTAATR